MLQEADVRSTNGKGGGFSGQVKAIANLFIAPSKTFVGVAANRWWVVPFTLCVVAGLGYSAKVSHYRMEDLKADIQSDPTNSPAEVQRRLSNIDAQRIAHVTPLKLAYSALAMAALHGVKVFGLALVLWLAVQLSTARVHYMTLVSAVAFMFLVKIPEYLLTAPLIILKGTSKISLGPVVFLPPEWYGSPLYRLLVNLDIFSLWMAVIMAIALPIVAGISTKKSVLTVTYLWAVWGLAGVFLGNMFRIT